MEFRKMRRFKQALSQDDCLTVLLKEKRAVLAVNGDGGYPYAMTINYYFAPDNGHIYFHGAKAGHKYDAMKADSRVCLTVCEQGEQRGDWSYHARSVTVFGRVSFTDDPEAAKEHARRLAQKYYPAEEHDQIEPDIAKNASRMQIFEIIPEHITGKLVHEK